MPIDVSSGSPAIRSGRSFRSVAAKHRRFALAVAAVACWEIGACGRVAVAAGDKNVAPGESVRTVEVSAKEYAFDPSVIEAKKGEKIRIVLKNEGTIAHSLVLNEEARTETIQPGERDAFTFVVRGEEVMRFECAVVGHATVGMKGTIELQ